MSVAAPIKPAALPQSPPAAVPQWLPRLRRWTVAEYQCAIAAGVFRPDERLELIRGEILTKMPANPPHATAVTLAADGIARSLSLTGCFIRQEKAIVLPQDGQPEPDVAVVRGHVRDYGTRHPEPADVLLLVEVSDSTLAFDRDVKSVDYATAGIREYWILNLPERQLEVHRDPANGAWATTFTVPETGTVSPLANPQATVAVADLLP